MAASDVMIRPGRLARRAALAGIVAAVLVGTAFHDGLVAHANAASAATASTERSTADARPARTLTKPAARRLTSTGAAVAAHLLDPAVLDALVRDGSVDAMVAFESGAVVHSATIEAPKGKGHKKAIVEGLAKGFGAAKAHAFGKGAGLTVLRAYRYLPTAFVRFRSEAAILRVLRDPGVLGITMPRSYAAADAESGPQIGQDVVAADGNIGDGTYVAVLDSGVDVTRAAFGSCSAPGVAGCKVEQLTELPNTADGVYDDILHGTHVAGIALSIATGAKVLAWDVFDQAGFAQDADVTTAINAVVGLAATKTIASVNLSLAGKGTYHNVDCATVGGLVNQYVGPVAALRAVGVAPVFAAGNTAVKNGTFTQGVAYPSCTPGAIRVGAVYDGDTGGWAWMGGTAYACTDSTTALDKITCFSQSSSSMPMVLAPGAMIDAAGINDGGTSMAAPHVAAAFAILRAAKPTASLTALQAAILGSGPVLNDTRFGTAIPKHRLDLVAALAAVSDNDTTPPVVAKPGFAFTANTTVTTGAASTGDASWSATDNSGIQAYALQVWYDGEWHDFTSELDTPTSRSIRLSGWAKGTDYAVAVAAQDGAGNWSDWKVSDTWRITSVGEKGTGVSRSASGWTRTTWTKALGGRLSYSRTAGKWTKFTFIGGRRVAWISTMATNRGVAKVYLNGTLVKRIDLRAGSTFARRLVYQASGLNPAKRYVLKIVVVGTSGRPRVDVDGFLVTN